MRNSLSNLENIEKIVTLFGSYVDKVLIMYEPYIPKA